jgi:translation initiation factor 1 (eIF-1/SUI1)
MYADVHIHIWNCYDGVKQQEVNEIKLQGDTRFEVENPLNTRGKNHGR